MGDQAAVFAFFAAGYSFSMAFKILFAVPNVVSVSPFFMRWTVFSETPDRPAMALMFTSPASLFLSASIWYMASF